MRSARALAHLPAQHVTCSKQAARAQLRHQVALGQQLAQHLRRVRTLSTGACVPAALGSHGEATAAHLQNVSNHLVIDEVRDARKARERGTHQRPSRGTVWRGGVFEHAEINLARLQPAGSVPSANARASRNSASARAPLRA